MARPSSLAQPGCVVYGRVFYVFRSLLLMALYAKPYLSLPDQVALLKSRGLLIADEAAAQECLHRNGYYRLSAYWYLFRKIENGKRTNIFLPDSRFDDAVDLYRFDKALKLCLLDAIERIEIAVRVEIAMLLGRRDIFAHTNAALFHPNFTSRLDSSGFTKYDKWINKFNQQVSGATDEFMQHFERQYGGRAPLPIWIAIELWDFGLLSRMFSGMRKADQAAVAKRFSVPDWQLMESWLWSLNYVRNVIAHHGRLWNVNLSVNPKLPQHGLMPGFDPLHSLKDVQTRIYSICCILSYLTRVINPQSSWIKDFQQLVDSFPIMPYAAIRHMGFPADWKTQTFWA